MSDKKELSAKEIELQKKEADKKKDIARKANKELKRKSQNKIILK